MFPKKHVKQGKISAINRFFNQAALKVSERDIFL